MHSHSLTLEALDERLRQLEVTHVRKLAETEKRDRDSLAPTPDYSIGPLVPAPEACSCEESLALRAELASAQARVTELEAIVDGLRESEARSRAERQAILDACGASADVDEGRDPVEAARAVRADAANWSDQWLTERTRRLELERAYAASIIDLAPRIGSRALVRLPEAVETLMREYASWPLGECDRCGKRAPLKTQNPGLHEKDVCAWGCEVKP